MRKKEANGIMKRVLVTVLSMLMVLSMMPSIAFAEGEEGPEAKIGETEYATLSAALDAALDGDTVVLLKDIESGRISYSGTKDFTLDLGGKTLKDRLSINSGTVTIQNGEIIGRLDAYDSSTVTVAATATVTGTGDTAVQGADGSGIVVWGDGTFGQSGCKTPILNLYGTVHNTDYTAISTNGTDLSKPIINIYDGAVVISEEDVAIYQPSGTVTITGGTITGATAIYQKTGLLSISGTPVITGNGAQADFVHSGNGCNATGDAVVVENCDYPAGLPVAKILGGTFVSENAKTIASYAYGNDPSSDPNEPIAEFVHGGTFGSNKIDPIVLDEGMTLTWDEDAGGYVVAPVTTAIEDLQDTVDALQEQVATSKATIIELQNAISTLDGDVDGLSAALESAITRLETAEAKIAALQSDYVSEAELDAAITDIEAEIARVNRAIRDDVRTYVDRKVANLQSQITASGEAISALLEAVESLDDEINGEDGLAGALASLSSDVSDLADDLAYVQTTIDTLATKDELAEEIGDIEDAIEAIEAEIASVDRAIRDDVRAYVNRKVANLQGQINDLQDIIDALDDNYVTHDELDTAIEDARDAIEEAQALIDEAQNEKIETKASIDDMNDKFEEVEQRIEDSLDEAKEYADELASDLNDMIDDLQDQIDELEDKIDDLDDRISDLEDAGFVTSDDLEDAIYDAKEEIAAAQEIVDAAQDEDIAENALKLAKLTKACKKAKAELIEADAAILEAAMAYTDEAAEALQDQIDSLDERVTVLEEADLVTSDDLNDAISAAKDEIADAQALVDEAQDESIVQNAAKIIALANKCKKAVLALQAADEETLNAAMEYTDAVKAYLKARIKNNAEAIQLLQEQVDTLDDTYVTHDELDTAIEDAATTIQTAQAVVDALQDIEISNNAATITKLIKACKKTKEILEAADEATLLAAQEYTDAAKEELQAGIDTNTALIEALQQDSEATTEQLEALAAVVAALEIAQSETDALQDIAIENNAEAIEKLTKACKKAIKALQDADDEVLELAMAYTDQIAAGLQTQIQANTDLIREVEEKAATKTGMAEAIAEAKAAIETAQAAVDAAQDAALTGKASELSAAINTAKAELQAADAQTLSAANAYADSVKRDLQANIDANRALIDALRDTAATKDGLREAIADATTSIQTAQSAVDAVQDAALISKANELMEAINTAKSQSEAADADVLRLAKDYTDEVAEVLQAQIDDNRDKLSKLDETYATDIEVATAIANATATIQAAQAQVDALQNIAIVNDKTELTNLITTSVANLQIVDAQILAAAQAYADAAARDLQSQIDQNKAAIDNLDSTYATDQEVVNAIQSAINYLERTQAATDAIQDANLIINVNELRSRINAAVIELKALDAETLRAAKAYTDSIKDDLQKQITENKKRLDNLDDIYATDEEVAKAIAKAKEAIETAQKAVDDAQDKAVAKSVAELNDSIKALNAALLLAVAELQAADVATLEAAKAYTDAKVAYLQEQIDQSKDAEEGLQIEIDELTEELKQAFADNINVALSVTPTSCNQVKASWDTSKLTVDGAHVSYALFFKKSGDTVWIKACDMTCDGTGTPLSFTIGSLFTGTTYNFKIVPSIMIDNELIVGSESVELSAKPTLGKASISKITRGKKKLTVKIKKVTGANGYQIAYRLTSSASQKKVYTTSTSKTIKKLKAKKLYEVRVRAYRNVNGAKVYGAWSEFKYGKTK